MTRTTSHTESFSGPQSSDDSLERCCQWDGCKESGAYRAPKDKSLSEYYVFCLEHVRVYNAQWNFHEGMGSDEMEQEYRSAATWDRPTWKMGQRQAPGRPWHDIFDPFDVFPESASQESGSRKDTYTPDQDHLNAMRVLGLKGALTIDSLKARYKELVKRHHPDANGGSQEAENRMKTINAAYQTLRLSITS